MNSTQCNKPADRGSGETVPSGKMFASWVAPLRASLPSAYFEGSPDSAKLSRTNLFRTAHFEKNQFENFQTQRL
jgi:hypothetical protein